MLSHGHRWVGICCTVISTWIALPAPAIANSDRARAFWRAMGIPRRAEKVGPLPREELHRNLTQTLRLLRHRGFIPRRGETRHTPSGLYPLLREAWGLDRVELSPPRLQREARRIANRLLRPAQSVGWRGEKPRVVVFRQRPGAERDFFGIQLIAANERIAVDEELFAFSARLGADLATRGTANLLSSIGRARHGSGRPENASTEAKRYADAIAAAVIGHEIVHFLRGDMRAAPRGRTRRAKLAHFRGRERAADIGATELALRAGLSPLGPAVVALARSLEGALSYVPETRRTHPRSDRYRYTASTLRRLKKSLATSLTVRQLADFDAVPRVEEMQPVLENVQRQTDAHYR